MCGTRFDSESPFDISNWSDTDTDTSSLMFWLSRSWACDNQAKPSESWLLRLVVKPQGRAARQNTAEVPMPKSVPLLRSLESGVNLEESTGFPVSLEPLVFGETSGIETKRIGSYVWMISLARALWFPVSRRISRTIASAIGSPGAFFSGWFRCPQIPLFD